MIIGDIAEKPTVCTPVLIEALENNRAPPDSAGIVITEEMCVRNLVYWELGVAAITPVSAMYRLLHFGEECAERMVGNVLNNIYNRGLLSLVNPRGADGTTACSGANLRAWRNRVLTDKGLAGKVNLMIYDRDGCDDPHAAILFALSIVDIGGSACIRVPPVNTTLLAGAIYAFASYFTARLHRANNGSVWLVGTAKTKTMRAETMFTLATVPRDASLYTAMYMRMESFQAAITAMLTLPKLPTIDEWKRTYKYTFCS